MAKKKEFMRKKEALERAEGTELSSAKGRSQPFPLGTAGQQAPASNQHVQYH